MTAPRSAGALAGYRSATYDDAVAPDGSVRPPARALMDAVLAHDVAALGSALVEPGDLELRDGRLRHDGAVVDTVYRRTNADLIDSEVGELLHPVLAAGALRVVNYFGTGIADDKLAHAYVPAMIRFYLAEDPLIDQVETFDRGDPETLERALADVAALRANVRDAPDDYVAQRLVPISTHPTEVDGTLVPRHVDPRPFVLMAGADEARVLPGGLTRVALDAGALVVNSSQNRGAKDTWVLP